MDLRDGRTDGVGEGRGGDDENAILKNDFLKKQKKNIKSEVCMMCV